MSIRARLTAPVETIPAWRYLLEKAAHVALASWAVAHLARGFWPWIPAESVYLAAVVAVLYTAIGKVLWHARHRGEAARVLDMLRDLVVAMAPAVLAAGATDWRLMALGIVAVALAVCFGPARQ